MRCRRWSWGRATMGGALVGLLLLGLAGSSPADTGELQECQRLVRRLSEALETHQMLARQATKYNVVFQRDPLQPMVDDQGEVATLVGLSGGLSVQGIIWSNERPLVVVDDELFEEGDRIGPYEILKIRHDDVVVRRGDDETITIPIDRGGN